MAALTVIVYNSPVFSRRFLLISNVPVLCIDEGVLVPFRALLSELVQAVDGAQGAIFLDKEGEAVQWYARDEDERLRLRAAYVAVVLSAFRAVSERLGLGQTRRVLLEYKGARFVVEELEAGYFVLLELNLEANVGEALYRIQPAIQKIRAEIGV